MTSVGAPSRPPIGTTKEDAIKRMSEKYADRESNLIQQQKEEVAGLKNDHKQKLEKVVEAYEERLHGARVRSEDALTKQEQRFQKEIEDMREAYQRQQRAVSQQRKLEKANGSDQ